VTNESLGRFCAADLNARRKFQVEFCLWIQYTSGHEERRGYEKDVLDVKDCDHLCKMRRFMIGKE
jgi:hypothetical protein